MGIYFLSTNTWQGDADVSAEVPRVVVVTPRLFRITEVISEDIGIRDKRIRDKSPRTKKRFSQDKDSALRELISICLS